MKNLPVIIPLVVLLCFIISCQQQVQVERIMEDGVEVIVNHLEPYKIRGEPTNLILEKIFSIDSEMDEIAEIGLTKIWGFDIDSEGNIYAFMRQSNENFIFKFDQNGSFITSFGRKGDGPGELRYAFYLRVDFQENITISEPRRKLIIYDKNGNYLKQVALKQYYMEALPLINGNYLVKKRVRNPDSMSQEWPLILCDAEFEEIKEFDKFIEPSWGIVKKLLFPTMVLINCVSDGKIYLVNTEKGYEIREYDLEGNLLKKIRKEYQPVEVPEEMKKDMTKQFEDPKAAELRATTSLSFRSHCFPIQNFFSDDVGHLFVMTFEKSEIPGEYIYDVFNREGIFILRTSFENIGMSGPWNNRYATAKNHRLYCLREKKSGFKELVVYKIKWE
jgi:hypothetical protein